MTEIKKKNYVSPSMEVYEVKSMQLLAGSPSQGIGGGDGGIDDGDAD